MLKFGFVLMLIGGVVAVLFIFLPLYAPENGFSKATLTPLLCGSGEFYVSDTAFGTDIGDAPTASLNGFCVAAGGERHSVTDKQVAIGMIGGGAPLVVGLLLVLLTRFIVMFKQAAAMGSRQSSLYNVTNQAVKFSKPPNDEELRESGIPVNRGSLSERLAEIDAAYSARRISRDEYETMRKKIIDDSNY